MDDVLARLETALSSAAVATVGAQSCGSVGTDIVSVDRIRRIRSRNAGRFDSLAFTRREIAYCRSKQNPDVHFAGHLAAKEAAYKALGLTWDRAFSWRFMEVVHLPNGSSAVVFRSGADEGPKQSIVRNAEISIAHTDEYAIAVAQAND